MDEFQFRLACDRRPIHHLARQTRFNKYFSFVEDNNESRRRQVHSSMMMGGGTGPDPDVMDAIGRGNAVVFFDVALGEGANAAELGRIKLELFVKDVRTEFLCLLVLLRLSRRID